MIWTRSKTGLAQQCFKNSNEIAERLQRELDARPRPTAEEIAQLEATVQEFERRYEIPSNEVHEAIEDHRLHETADVVQWIFAIRALERARARVAAFE